MQELVILKVRIHREMRQRRRGLRLENVYPDFNALGPELLTPPGGEAPMDWSAYVSHVGFGWIYDQVSGFGQADEENPRRDILFGCIGVPEAFAAAAVAAFPDTCSVMDPDAFVTWRRERGMITAPEVTYDAERLAGLRNAIELAKDLDDPAALAELRAQARRAIDPQDDARGINANRSLDWDSFARGRGIRLKGRP